MNTLTASVASEPSRHKQTYSGKTTKDYPVNSLTAQIGRTIRRLRESKDLNQTQLSAMSYIANGHLSNIETGQKNISAFNIECLCAGLGITTLEFYQELCVTIEKGW